MESELELVSCCRSEPQVVPISVISPGSCFVERGNLRFDLRKTNYFALTASALCLSAQRSSGGVAFSLSFTIYPRYRGVLRVHHSSPQSLQRHRSIHGPTPSSARMRTTAISADYEVSLDAILAGRTIVANAPRSTFIVGIGAKKIRQV